jgi:hypothetical protein
MANIHKMQRIFIEAKLDDEIIPENQSIIKTIKQAKSNKKIHQLKKGIYLSAHRTTYKGDDAVLMIFSCGIPGTISGSSAATEIVMDLIQTIERIFSPIDDIYYDNEMEGIIKNVAVLKVIKKIREDDIF